MTEQLLIGRAKRGNRVLTGIARYVEENPDREFVAKQVCEWMIDNRPRQGASANQVSAVLSRYRNVLGVERVGRKRTAKSRVWWKAAK